MTYCEKTFTQEGLYEMYYNADFFDNVLFTHEICFSQQRITDHYKIYYYLDETRHIQHQQRRQFIFSGKNTQWSYTTLFADV